MSPIATSNMPSVIMLPAMRPRIKVARETGLATTMKMVRRSISLPIWLVERKIARTTSIRLMPASPMSTNTRSMLAIDTSASSVDPRSRTRAKPAISSVMRLLRASRKPLRARAEKAFIRRSLLRGRQGSRRC